MSNSYKNTISIYIDFKKIIFKKYTRQYTLDKFIQFELVLMKVIEYRLPFTDAL